ncbi:MAG: hypothetical protein KDB53_04940 [Planctomycetes bacterium]|nr:hypothetical protein [Planctomycetota bacterium]
MKRLLIVALIATAAMAIGPPAARAAGAKAPQETEAQDAQTQFEALAKEFTALERAYRSKYRKATAEERKAMASEAPDIEPVIADMLALAKAHPKSEGAGQALNWVWMRAKRSEDPSRSEMALKTLLKDYGDAAVMEDVARSLARSSGDDRPFAVEVLTSLAEDSPRDLVRKHAKFGLAGLLEDEQPEKAIALYEACKAYDDVVLYRDVTIADKAEGALYELRNLRVGMTAPEIEHADADGVTFKLSDYRGKVVLLDFWGHW